MSDWSQTVNDIYQQEFGRQADESGMASFTAALNQGMTGEQMRETLRSSPEGQSIGAAAPIDSGGGGALPVSDPGFYQPPNTTDWTQTVNDIYQQEFGRQADPSGMATFSNQLSQGMTGEQIRDQLRSSPEGQSYGLSPSMGGGALPTALDPSEGWEWQPPSALESGGTSQAYWANVNTGDRRELATPMNIQAVRDEAGNVSYYTNADTGEIIDPKKFDKSITGYAPELTNLYRDLLNREPDKAEIAAYDERLKEGSITLDDVYKGFTQSPERLNQVMPFLDPNADVNTKFEQGVRGFDAKGLTRDGYLDGLPTHYYDPQTGKLAAWFGTLGDSTQTDDYTWHTVDELSAIPNSSVYLAQESKRDVGADWRSLGKNAAMIWGSMAMPGLMAYMAPAAGAAGAGLTAAEAATLMGGTLSEAGAASTLGGTLASQGVNWGAVATQAAKTAAINAAVTAANGGNVGDVLKAGALGAVTGGAGVAGADLMGGGTLAQIGTQTAISTAIAAARGQNPYEAALTGAITATLSNVIPAGTADVLNGAGITDPSIQKAVNSAISSSVVAAIRGGDVGTAAIMGAVNSGLTSVMGMIGNSQVVQDIKANITNALTSTIDSVKYEIGATNAQALPIEGSNRSPVGTVLDTAPYDADAELDRIIQNLPSSASGVEYTPAAPPLVQAAINQNTSNPDDLNQFFANYTPSVGAPLGTYAGAVTSDADPLALSSGDDYVYYRDAQGNEVYGPRSMAPSSEVASTDTTAGGFLGAFEGLAPAKVYGSAVPQVDAGGNVIRYDQPAQDTSRTLPDFLMNLPTEIRDQALGIYEVGMNQLGFVVGNVAAAGYGAGKTWYNLATGEPVDPAKINEISNEIAKRLSYTPQTEAGQVLAQAIPDAINSAMGSSMGLPPVTNLAALPTVGTIPKPSLGLLGGDVGNAIANVQRGITMEGPRSFGTTVGETIGGLFPKIDSTVAAIPETGALGTATTPRIGYSPTEARANPLTPERVESLRRSFIEPDYEINPRYPTTPSVATQLAPEPRGALPTTFAEAPTIRPIDLGSAFDSSSVATITEQARAVDQNLSRLDEPQVQAQVKTFVENTYAEFAQETPSAFTAKSLGDIYGIGGTSQDVVNATKSVVDNKAAPPEVILKQVDKATDPLNADEQLPAKLAMLSNASKLGITPAEAIKLGLLNNNGTKTELGEKVSPEPQPQPQPRPQPQPKPQPYPDPVAPLTPVKPTLPVKPPLPPIPTPPGVNPPPPVVNPVNPVVNPPVNPVNPPAVDVNPPIPTPPPLVQAAITPPAATPKASAPATTMTPSYMYAGAQGTAIGALPGNLQSTFLQGVNVNEYNPFENYNVYQQLGSPAPIRAAQGGSPLQLAQMQQGVAGIDPSLYSVLQKRQVPNYFTYGTDTSGGNPTTFAGSQLMGKPTPGIPVIPTGQKAGSDWLYQGSGTNPLAMAGTGIANLPTGMMAEGGQAHGGEDEHIPEFITGATGHYVRGRGDGTSDEIPAMLANNEYVFDADTVSALGNGSSDAGADFLDKFREAIRSHKRSAPADKIPPKASPLEYMKEALQNVGRK